VRSRKNSPAAVSWIITIAHRRLVDRVRDGFARMRKEMTDTTDRFERTALDR
jgi:DNA-directed RNA polymerase specialized sigma24 family protein